MRTLEEKLAGKKERPKCSRCSRRSTLKYLLEHDGLCGPCYSLSKLLPYDQRGAEEILQKLGREGKRFDQMVTEVRRIMQPPPVGSWGIGFVAELDSKRLNWEGPKGPPPYGIPHDYHRVPLRDVNPQSGTYGQINCKRCA